MSPLHPRLPGLMLACVVALACAGRTGAPVSGQPQSGKPVPPRVADVDLRQLPITPGPAPGAPGKNVPDLRQTDPATGSATLGRIIIRVTPRGLALLSADGAMLAGPIAFRSFWPAGAEPCGVEVESPPAVHADPGAGRFVIVQTIQRTAAGSLPVCIAVSRAADAVTGGWWLYDFALPLPGSRARLEMSGATWQLSLDGVPRPAARVVLDRAAMLAGAPASFTVR